MGVYKPTFFRWVAPLCNYERMEVNQSKALRVTIITLMIVVRVIIINDSYLIVGYGSIPIKTIFSGMNIHESQLF